MSNATTSPPAARGRKWKWILGLAALLALVAGAVLIIRFQGVTSVRPVLENALQQMGAWAPVVFVLIYIVACVALIPASILTLAAGAVFGVLQGAIYVHIAATLGAAAAFLNGRYLARDWVSRKLASHPKFEAIDRAVAGEGWKIVLLTRLCPILPFFLLNYAFGLTRVRFKDYFWASWIGMVPGTTLFVYIGSLANLAATKHGPMVWSLRIIGLLLLVAITAYITRVARRALAQELCAPVTSGEDDPHRQLRR